MKKCKGIGKANEFQGCGVPTDVRKFGLCRSCLFKWSRENKQGKEWFDSQLLKTRAKNKRIADKEAKEARKSISRLIQEARVPFQKWIRMRDANFRCISCGADSEIWHAGHYYKAELFTGTIFDEVNVNKQCAKCNTYLHGNEAGYRVGLLNRYGTAVVEALDKRAEQGRLKRFSREEIQEVKKTYLNKLK